MIIKLLVYIILIIKCYGCEFDYKVYDIEDNYDYNLSNLNYNIIINKYMFIDIIDIKTNRTQTTDLVKLLYINNIHNNLKEILLYRYLYTSIECNCINFRYNKYRSKISVCYYYDNLNNMIDNKFSIKIYIDNIIKEIYQYDKYRYNKNTYKKILNDFRNYYIIINYYNVDLKYKYKDYIIMLNDMNKLSIFIRDLWFNTYNKIIF